MAPDECVGPETGRVIDFRPQQECSVFLGSGGLVVAVAIRQKTNRGSGTLPCLQDEYEHYLS